MPQQSGAICGGSDAAKKMPGRACGATRQEEVRRGLERQQPNAAMKPAAIASPPRADRKWRPARRGATTPAGLGIRSCPEKVGTAPPNAGALPSHQDCKSSARAPTLASKKLPVWRRCLTSPIRLAQPILHREVLRAVVPCFKGGIRRGVSRLVPAAAEVNPQSRSDRRPIVTSILWRSIVAPVTVALVLESSSTVFFRART